MFRGRGGVRVSIKTGFGRPRLAVTLTLTLSIKPGLDRPRWVQAYELRVLR